MYDENLNEQLIKSRIEPEAEYSHEAYFYQNFVFKRSENYQRLKANANGVTADVFEGCHFKAKQGRLILVYVSGGNLQFNRSHSDIESLKYNIRCNSTKISHFIYFCRK